MLGLSNFVNDVIFQGDRRSYWHPAHFGLQGHPFTCQTSDGEKLGSSRKSGERSLDF